MPSMPPQIGAVTTLADPYQMSLLDSAVSNGGEEVNECDTTVTRCFDAPLVNYVTQGDARHLPIPPSSVDLIVTSPPYFGLRDYGRAEEIGGEATLAHDRIAGAVA